MTEQNSTERERAIYALTHDSDGEDTGDLRVPCSRWGTTGVECAEVAYDLDTLLVELGCDPSTPESLEHAMSLVVNDHDEVAYTFREHGSVELRERYAEQLGTDDAHIAHARYLGADAALAAASWLTMSEADATSILDGDGDPGVLDRYPEPTLGDWEEGCNETLGMQLDCSRWSDAYATAWEQGRDGCWSDAVEAFAYRVVGNIPMALAIEASNEAYVASLRTAAGL